MKRPVLSALPLALLAIPAAAQDDPAGLAYQLSYSYNLDNDLSPDGSRMVYISVIEGQQQLFTMDASGRNQRQITHADAHHTDPAWSPDGSTIAFVLEQAGTRKIHLIDPDGSNLRPLPHGETRAIHPSWTPDSRRILYSTDDDLDPPRKNRSEIYAIDIATGDIETLVSGGTNTFPVMSPDGRRIAYRHMVGDNSEVFVADADGSNPTNLTDHPAFDGWPEWSPDGRKIAFASNRNSAYQVFVMDADGGSVRLVANTEGRATVPRWSPDARTITFTRCINVDYRRSCEIMAVDVGNRLN